MPDLIDDAMVERTARVLVNTYTVRSREVPEEHWRDPDMRNYRWWARMVLRAALPDAIDPRRKGSRP